MDQPASVARSRWVLKWFGIPTVKFVVWYFISKQISKKK